MKTALLFFVLCLSIFAQETASKIDAGKIVKTDKEVRFQIVEITLSGSMKATVKIDTLTGKCWILTVSPDSVKSLGTGFVWIEMPNISLDVRETPHTLIHDNPDTGLVPMKP